MDNFSKWAILTLLLHISYSIKKPKKDDVHIFSIIEGYVITMAKELGIEQKPFLNIGEDNK